VFKSGIPLLRMLVQELLLSLLRRMLIGGDLSCSSSVCDTRVIRWLSGMMMKFDSWPDVVLRPRDWGHPRRTFISLGPRVYWAMEGDMKTINDRNTLTWSAGSRWRPCLSLGVLPETRLHLWIHGGVDDGFRRSEHILAEKKDCNIRLSCFVLVGALKYKARNTKELGPHP